MSMRTVKIIAVTTTCVVFGSVAAHSDGTVPDYTWAFVGYVEGGGSFYDETFYEDETELTSTELGHLNIGGRFILPLTGYWNIQLGGETRQRFATYDGEPSGTITTAWASGIGYWQDDSLGAIGLEVGFRDNSLPIRTSDTVVKIGGAAEFFGLSGFSLAGYGGFLLPIEKDSQLDDGAYAGGRATYYVSNNFAFDGFADWSVLNTRLERHSLRAGGRLRYKTSMSGVEVWGSGAYAEYWEADRGEKSYAIEGFQVLAGVSVNLVGGRPQPQTIEENDKTDGLDTSVYQFRF